MKRFHTMQIIRATALLPMALACAAAMLSGCPTDEGDEDNCATCALDSAEEQACIDALRGCEETEETDTLEEHEACEEAANANCE